MKDRLIGVLAIQGDFRAHMNMLKRIGVKCREVRSGADMEGITHLIFPGGESTTIRRVAGSNGLWDKLSGFEGPVMGTCMGSVIMASRIESPEDQALGMIDMTIKRNAYGRQINSFSAEGKMAFLDKPFEMVFIRAPKIVKTGEKVEPIAWLGDEITGVRSGNKIAFTFHPELTDNMKPHEFFVNLG
jgi:5'-phosphate synthase pdxT subunit